MPIELFGSYAKQKDLCDEQSKTSRNSYLADQLADLPPSIDIQWPRVELRLGQIRSQIYPPI